MIRNGFSLCSGRCALARFASTSSDKNSALTSFRRKDIPDTKRAKGIIGRIFPKSIFADTETRNKMRPPTNLTFPNPRGIENYDPDVPMKTLLTEGPSVLKKHTTKLCKEVYDRYIATGINTKWSFMHKEILGSFHNETLIQYDFKDDDSLKNWTTGCDSDWSQGYSKCELTRTDRGTALFQGTLSTRLVKDGKTVRAGWCNMKSVDKRAFERKKFYGQDWIYYNHLLIKCRGDGRTYKVMLHTPLLTDVTWGDSHSYQLHTHGGPYWQYEKIPFSRFIHTVNMRIQDRQRPIEKLDISSIGITLMDRINGDFKLEIGFIGVCHDASHTEECAWEAYQLDIPYTE
ncbi:complex I intermediate-associated protein 30 (CIA30) domain-containing protein [Ditylenchus destructor]|uniref:Complex I intermediate-associated protein 30 (CIA30) domain-containing protein n=1 Tax=Ditylenchus destructor TaxID=166010 RepID=A0AAD4NB51_9BILA|nr:complex I intermediate-associated protein 30 (CIA30) domain-containing protein [Ditylenchus destructor]